jgi:hypothetical protein
LKHIATAIAQQLVHTLPDQWTKSKEFADYPIRQLSRVRCAGLAPILMLSPGALILTPERSIAPGELPIWLEAVSKPVSAVAGFARIRALSGNCRILANSATSFETASSLGSINRASVLATAIRAMYRRINVVTYDANRAVAKHEIATAMVRASKATFICRITILPRDKR